MDSNKNKIFSTCQINYVEHDKKLYQSTMNLILWKNDEISKENSKIENKINGVNFKTITSKKFSQKNKDHPIFMKQMDIDFGNKLKLSIHDFFTEIEPITNYSDDVSSMIRSKIIKEPLINQFNLEIKKKIKK